MYPDRSIAAAALALLAAIPASPVLADETDSEAEAIVVTATRQATRASELLSDVSVIERADIEKAGSLETLGELLSREGGVEFSSLGAPGSASSIYIRGANAGHTLLLIDGVRVGSATMGAPTFSALPLAQIERIEILKGSASSLYGSDAIGGVIHVITRKGGGPAQLSADASIGSYGTREANASVSGQANALHYSLNLGTVSSDGFNSINNAANPYYNADEDGFRRQSATAQVSGRTMNWVRRRSTVAIAMTTTVTTTTPCGIRWQRTTSMHRQPWKATRCMRRTGSRRTGRVSCASVVPLMTHKTTTARRRGPTFVPIRTNWSGRTTSACRSARCCWRRKP